MTDAPRDYGSDVYDQVEVLNAPAGIIPFGKWLDKLMVEACPDCRANLFVRYAAPLPDWPASSGYVDRNGHTWYVAIAHDDDCPTLRRIEGQ